MEKVREKSNFVISDDLKDFVKGCESHVKYLGTPVKSENDRKEYRVLQLGNGLKALLISDIHFAKRKKGQNGKAKNGIINPTNFVEVNASVEVEQKMAACCLSINVGTFSDPPEIQGMAHLLEHVVTLGSKKYPEVNEYNKFIMDRGGLAHADTGAEATNFLFEIHPDYLLPALDRFAHLFVDPLLDKNTVLRERESIDNEFLLDVPIDYERLKQFFRVAARKENPGSKFSCGNLVTLRDNVKDDTLYEELLAFRERHYSAHRMTLAIQATLSLDTLEEYVIKCFSNVPVNYLSPDNFMRTTGVNLFDAVKLKKIYKIQSVQNTCELEIKCIMPPSIHLYKIKPINYISWIMNREGEGSLSHHLRKKKLCDRLSVNHEQLSMYSVLKINLVLSGDGNSRIKEILDIVFAYTNTLRLKGVQEDIHEEMKRIAEIKFRYADDISAVASVRQLSPTMHLYPPAEYLTGSYLYEGCDATVIQRFLDCLTPENTFIVLMSDEMADSEFTEIESWYGVRYSSQDIPDDWYVSWQRSTLDSGSFTPNIFVPTDFSLVDLPPDAPVTPVRIVHDETMEIWHKYDDKFRTPKCFVCLQLMIHQPSLSPDTVVMWRLFETLLHEVLIEDLHEARCVGLGYKIVTGRSGLVVGVNGFSQKVPMLLEIIMKRIASFAKILKESTFQSVKRQLLKYYSSVLSDPGTLASDIMSSVLEPNFWLSTEKHTALKRITYKQFINFAMQVTNNVYIRCLVQGNITKNEAIKLICESTKLQQRSKKPRTVIQKMNNVILPVGKKICQARNQNTIDGNSVVMNYYQTNFAFMRLALPVYKEFLEMLIQEHLFNQLRTQEQLSYSISYTWRFDGFAITIYSPIIKYSTEYLDERVEASMKRFSAALKEISTEEFTFKKNCFLKRKLCSDVNLKDEVDRNWSAINSEYFVFDDCQQQSLELSYLKIEEFWRWIVDCVVDEKIFRKVSVRVEGNANSRDICNRRR